jgi:tetratricopeptide (TPR) repeat protein
MPQEISRNLKLAAGMESAAGMVSYFLLHIRNGARFCCPALLCGILLLSFIYAPAVRGAPLLSAADKKDLYSQGTDFFHQATEKSESDPAAAKDLYAKALLRFERLVEEGGVRNGKLFYNIGNIYFLLDDVGIAILNYRRAEQYIPNDPNLIKNLAYARSMRQDKLDRRDQEKILQTLFFFHYDLRTRTRLIVFGAFYLAFWIFVGIKIFSRRPFTSWGLGIALLFSLSFGASLFVQSRQSTGNTDGVILAQEVIGRQGDAESYQPSFKDPLHAGTEFTLLEDRGAWWQIELPDGRTSWIPAKSGELVRKDRVQGVEDARGQGKD